MEYRYRPWVGKKYNKSNIFGTKLLILGESHYGYDDMYATEIKNVTIGIVKTQFDPKKSLRFYTSVYKICTDHLSNISKKEFWDSVLFYNYIQTKGELMKASDVPTEKQWVSGKELFLFTLKKYQPERILVLGIRLWNKLPADVGEFTEDKNYYYYLVSRTKKALSTVINHPSRYPRGSGERDSREVFVKLLKHK